MIHYMVQNHLMMYRYSPFNLISSGKHVCNRFWFTETLQYGWLKNEWWKYNGINHNYDKQIQGFTNEDSSTGIWCLNPGVQISTNTAMENYKPAMLMLPYLKGSLLVKQRFNLVKMKDPWKIESKCRAPKF